MLSDSPSSTAAREQRHFISFFRFLWIIMKTCSFEAWPWPKISLLEFHLMVLSETKKELKRIFFFFWLLLNNNKVRCT